MGKPVLRPLAVFASASVARLRWWSWGALRSPASMRVAGSAGFQPASSPSVQLWGQWCAGSATPAQRCYGCRVPGKGSAGSKPALPAGECPDLRSCRYLLPLPNWERSCEAPILQKSPLSSSWATRDCLPTGRGPVPPLAVATRRAGWVAPPWERRAPARHLPPMAGPHAWP